MKLHYFMPLVALMSAACGGQGDNAAIRADAESTAMVYSATPAIQLRWSIENVVINDTLYARPVEVDPDRPQYFTFAADGTFGVTTNCNSLGGEYIQHGDSIILSNIFITEMACDNMEVEELLMRILPAVRTIDCINDSVMRLNTDSTGYVVLRKAPIR